MSSEQALTFLIPGDVLFVKGSGGVVELGTTGGFFGHFLLVVAAPICVDPFSSEAIGLKESNPSLDATRLWKVETLESTRSHAGLHRSQMFVHVEAHTGRFMLVGELVSGSELVTIDDEPVQLWQSPTEIRVHIKQDAVNKVLSEMKVCEKSWSLATAARAVLMSADVANEKGGLSLLRDLRNCWLEAPICTSIIVIFWQRLLCRIALDLHQVPLDMILKWMPLKADRGLPGELIKTMNACEWNRMDHFPCAL